MTATVTPSIVRTVVPVAVGALSTLALKAGVHLDPGIATEAVTVGLTGVYYAVVRGLEQHAPKWGWLLGWATAPAYPADTSGKHAVAAVEDRLRAEGAHLVDEAVVKLEDLTARLASVEARLAPVPAGEPAPGTVPALPADDEPATESPAAPAADATGAQDAPAADHAIGGPDTPQGRILAH